MVVSVVFAWIMWYSWDHDNRKKLEYFKKVLKMQKLWEILKIKYYQRLHYAVCRGNYRFSWIWLYMYRNGEGACVQIIQGPAGEKSNFFLLVLAPELPSAEWVSVTTSSCAGMGIPNFTVDSKVKILFIYW